MRATAVPVTIRPANTGTITIRRLTDMKRPPDGNWLLGSDRQTAAIWHSPIGVFVAPALGLMLWHGGFRSPAQVALAGVAALGLMLYGADLRPTLLSAGLAVAAAAAVASLAWHRDRSSIAPVLAAIAVPCLI